MAKGSVQIMVQKDVYDTLDALKDRYRCKSYTDLLRKFCTDFDTRDMLAHEISAMFVDLKKHVVATVLNGKMSNMLEMQRVATVCVAASHPSYRPELIDRATSILEDAMHGICKLADAYERARKKQEEEVRKHV